MLHTYPRIFEPLHCPVHSLLCPGPGRTHRCRSSAQYLETPCTHVPQSSSLSGQSIHKDVSRFSVHNCINVVAGAHRPSKAGEHVTNTDGEIQTWWPDANLIWNGSNMRMQRFYGSRTQANSESWSSNNLHTKADFGELLLLPIVLSFEATQCLYFMFRFLHI